MNEQQITEKMHQLAKVLDYTFVDISYLSKATNSEEIGEPKKIKKITEIQP